MPPGTATVAVRCIAIRPAPWQVVHGVSMIDPRPRHSGQASVWTNWPSAVCCTRWMRPRPSHVGQRSGVVPGSAPSPPQRSHSPIVWKVTSRSTPNAASSNDSSMAAVASRPRSAARPPNSTSSPKNAPSRSDSDPKSMNWSVWNCAPESPSWPNRS